MAATLGGRHLVKQAILGHKSMFRCVHPVMDYFFIPNGLHGEGLKTVNENGGRASREMSCRKNPGTRSTIRTSTEERELNKNH